MSYSRKFEGVWIPKDLWLDPSLTLQEKCFLVEINSLDNEEGCFASNQYFADFFQISRVRVSEVINALVKKKMISSTIDPSKGNRRILRVINFSLIPSQRKVEEGHKGIFNHSNTSNSTEEPLERGAFEAQRDVMMDEIRRVYNSNILAYEQRWVEAVDRAILAGIRVEDFIRHLTNRLHDPSRKFNVTPEQVISSALEERAAKSTPAPAQSKPKFIW